jgi:integrase
LLRAAGVARSLAVPSADRRRPPDRLAADAPVGLGHLAAGHIGADRGRRDAQERGDIAGGPPVARKRLCHAVRVQRLRCLIPDGALGSLRWAELAALRRCDIDLEARTVRVFRQLAESPGSGFTFGPPKSAAGQRTVAFPDLIVPELAWHLARFAGPEDDGLLFTSPAGSPMRNSNSRRRVWLPALAGAGLADLHFHDLRHAGNVLAAAAGANLRELMERMGHSTTRAAIVYLHSTDERQRKVADALGDLARAELRDDRKRATTRGVSGTNPARRAARGTK